MIKAKVAFLEGRLFFSQSEPFETFQIALIGWIKAGSPKSHFCFDHVNRLYLAQGPPKRQPHRTARTPSSRISCRITIAKLGTNGI